MRSCDICVHTTDKKYTITPKTSEQEFSALNIGSHKLISNLNALNNRIWDASETVYWQLDSEYEFLTKQQQIDMIKAAFLETSLLTPLKIQEKRKQTGDAHIKINWLGAKDEKYFRDRSSVLAFAYGPQVGIGGDVTMNSDHVWRLDKTPITVKDAFDLGLIKDYDRAHPDNILKTFDPLHTMKHEGGGHSCGMRHLEDANLKDSAIMYPYYNGKRVFSKADRDYLFELYGESNIASRVSRFIQHYMGRF